LAGVISRFRAQPEGHTRQPEWDIASASVSYALGRYDLKLTRDKATEIVEARWDEIAGLVASFPPRIDPDPVCTVLDHDFLAA
jgi:hypothetical protein